MTFDSWRIYYGDGLIVDSSQSDWQSAPSDNVQVVIIFYKETYPIHRDGQLYTEPYRNVLHSKDYYWQAGNEYSAGQAPDVPLNASVKLGKLLDKETWRAIYNIAHADLRSRQL